MTPGTRLRRHVPPLLLLLALMVLVLAMARPSAVVYLPSQFKTIVLAIDTSGSMRATDVEPTRISAAQTAAKAFVQEVPADVRIGIVEFGATASQVQMPTSNREELIAAVDRFVLQRGTATGSGSYASLAMLFPGCRHRSGETGRRHGARARQQSADPPRETGHSARRPQSRRRKSRSCRPAPTRQG